MCYMINYIVLDVVNNTRFVHELIKLSNRVVTLICTIYLSVFTPVFGRVSTDVVRTHIFNPDAKRGV